MAKAVWLGAVTAVAVVTGIGLRYGLVELSRPLVSGPIPEQPGAVVPVDDPGAPFADVARQADALAGAVARAIRAILAPDIPPMAGSSVPVSAVAPSTEQPVKATVPDGGGTIPGKPMPEKAVPGKPVPEKPVSDKNGPEKNAPEKAAGPEKMDLQKPAPEKPGAGKTGTPPEKSTPAAEMADPVEKASPGGLDLAQMAERFRAPSPRTPVSADIPAAPPAPPPGATAFAPADQYPLSDWTLDYGEAGYLARVTLNGDPLAGRQTGLGDTVEASGWAGDSLIGIRFSHVLGAVCGRVVGVAPVQDPTPEIARTIHSNLATAGWTLRLPVELLPRCEKPMLTVLAVRDGKFAYPLRGDLALILPTETVKAPAAATTTPLRPGDLPFLERQPLTLTAKATTVRRCGASDCAPVGSLSAGDYSVAVMDRQKGWALLVTPTLSGWIPEGLLRSSGAARKSAPVKAADPKPVDPKPAEAGKTPDASG